MLACAARKRSRRGAAVHQSRNAHTSRSRAPALHARRLHERGFGDGGAVGESHYGAGGPRVLAGLRNDQRVFRGLHARTPARRRVRRRADRQLAARNAGPFGAYRPRSFHRGGVAAAGFAAPARKLRRHVVEPAGVGLGAQCFSVGREVNCVWAVYDAAGRPTWYALLSGSWLRDASNALRYTGTVYLTAGPYWGGAYDPAATTISAVGAADSLPTSTSHAQFSYTIQGITGSKAIERLRF